MPGEVDFLAAIAFGKQTALGTVNATIRDLVTGSGGGGEVILADGIVLGDPESGDLGDSGISYTESRRLREKAVVSGSFTKQASDFLAVDIDTLTFAFPFCGNRKTLSGTPADSEFAFPNDVGIDAILQAAGLAGAAWSGGVGEIYTPANAAPMTVKLWVGKDGSGNTVSRVFEDVFADLEISYTPGGVAICTVTMAVGSETTTNSYPKLETAPTFDYEEQASVSAPTVEEVGHAWGIGGVSRGFEEFSIQIANAIEDLQDSNAKGGIRKRQTGRTITITGPIISDTDDADFELTELRRTTAPSDALSFQVGDTGQAAGTALAHQINVPKPEVRELGPRKFGPSISRDLTLVATESSANAEFELILL